MDQNLPAQSPRVPEVLPAPAAAGKSRFRWLISPETKGFLLPLTGFWILGLDWAFFSEEVLSLGLAIPLISLMGFVLGSTGAFFFQKRFAGDTTLMAALKGLLAGVVVGIPWPMTGTIVGAWILLLAGIRSGQKPTSSD